MATPLTSSISVAAVKSEKSRLLYSSGLVACRSTIAQSYDLSGTAKSASFSIASSSRFCFTSYRSSCQYAQITRLLYVLLST